MSEDRFREILMSTPPVEEIEARANRARHRALARLDRPAMAARRRRWLPALAVAGGLLAVGLAWLPRGATVPPADAPPAAPLRVHLTLSDGTRVVWVLDDHFAM